MTSRRKGSLVIEWGGMQMLELILLFMFMVFVVKAGVAALNPDEQTVLINVNLLKNKIDEACSTGYASMNDFNFPQPSPPRFAGLVDVFAQIAIRTSGDPHYILYYEAFPVGEAVGWETYHDFNYRAVSPIDLHTNTPITISDFKAQMETHLQNVQNNIKAFLGTQYTSTPVLVNNIKLSNYLNVNPLEEASRNGNDKIKLGNAGDWKDDNKRFVFYSYNTLSSLDKSFIKYRTCDKNSLCLKTRSGVYVFPLNEACNGKYLQLNYDAVSTKKTAAITIAAGAATVVGVKLLAGASAATVFGKLASFIGKGLSFGIRHPVIAGTTATALFYSVSASIFKNTLTYKVSDFYAASPCRLKNLEFEREACDSKCTKLYSYPIYDYNPLDDKVTPIGSHLTCVSGLNSDVSPNNLISNAECIKIKVSEPREGYCWTPNPTTESIEWFSTDVLKKTILEIANELGATPVYSSNTYTENPFMYILKPSETSRTMANRLAEAVGNTWSWKWPSGGF